MFLHGSPPWPYIQNIFRYFYCRHLFFYSVVISTPHMSLGTAVPLNFTRNGKTDRKLRLLTTKSLPNDLAKAFHILCH